MLRLLWRREGEENEEIRHYQHDRHNLVLHMRLAP